MYVKNRKTEKYMYRIGKQKNEEKRKKLKKRIRRK